MVGGLGRGGRGQSNLPHGGAMRLLSGSNSQRLSLQIYISHLPCYRSDNEKCGYSISR